MHPIAYPLLCLFLEGGIFSCCLQASSFFFLCNFSLSIALSSFLAWDWACMALFGYYSTPPPFFDFFQNLFVSPLFEICEYVVWVLSRFSPLLSVHTTLTRENPLRSCSAPLPSFPLVPHPFICVPLFTRPFPPPSTATREAVCYQALP